MGLAKERSGNPGTSATLSNDPLDNLEETLLRSPPLLLFRFFLLDELNLPPTHPCGADTHAPIEPQIPHHHRNTTITIPQSTVT